MNVHPLLALVAGLSISACATVPQRVPYTLAELATASPVKDTPVRMWAQGDDIRYHEMHAEMIAQRTAASLPPPSVALALSGGSDKGAYSAGFLNAWTRRGDRPEFDVVTGVSTGALIAPFAFLGSAEDEALHTIYTNISQKDVFRKRGIAGIVRKGSFADTTPLQRLIERYTPASFIDRIAVEHRRGRRLFVTTTNVDAQRGVVWDMGAIAASRAPNRVTLFRQVLLASASIPGAFPPTLIDVTSGGRHFSEMHIDGGTVGGFFVLPRAIMNPQGAATVVPGSAIYVLYNGRLSPAFKVVHPRIFSVLQGSLATLLGEVDRASVDELRGFARETRSRIAVCAVEEPLVHDSAPIFDTLHMRELYALGERNASATDGCLKRP